MGRSPKKENDLRSPRVATPLGQPLCGAYRATTGSLGREPSGCGIPSCITPLRLRASPSGMGHPASPVGFTHGFIEQTPEGWGGICIVPPPLGHLGMLDLLCPTPLGFRGLG
jgi:hypothetical protein